MRHKTWGLLGGALFLATFLAGCHGDAYPEVTFIARDFEFDGPADLPTGWVRIIMENEGPDLHHVQLYRITGPHDADEARTAFNAENGTAPDWLDAVGGPNAVPPGATSTATVFIEAGEYILVCEIPDSEGIPHVKHGMFKELSAEAPPGDAGEPEGDIDLGLVDFGFVPGDTFQAGEALVEVHNDGMQPHEAVLVRLKDGATTQEFLAAFGPDATGPPPGQPLGGLSGIAAGDTAYFPVDLEPGSYTFLCFLTDPQSGAPHFALGMRRDFQVT